MGIFPLTKLIGVQLTEFHTHMVRLLAWLNYQVFQMGHFSFFAFSDKQLTDKLENVDGEVRTANATTRPTAA